MQQLGDTKFKAMFVERTLRAKHLVAWLTKPVIGLLIFNGILAIAYAHGIISVSVPWIPVSVIGTAVAFFVGFKNNQAYDRLWEARRIWGGIVNDSRSWSMMVMSFVRDFDEESKRDVAVIRKKLVYRHIAWLYAHRHQLLEPMQWEVVGADNHVGQRARKYDEKYGLGRISENNSLDGLTQFISSEELDKLKSCKNIATQLINSQSLALAELRHLGYFNDYKHVEMESLLRSFFALQGQNERIKKFPFPRDYSTISKSIVWLFIILMPFSLIPEMMKLGHWAFWLCIPIASLVGLVFVVMEDLGDYTENPFMGTPNCMPMLSICRTIENDMREMLGEKNIPASIKSVEGVLM